MTTPVTVQDIRLLDALGATASDDGELVLIQNGQVYRVTIAELPVHASAITGQYIRSGSISQDLSTLSLVVIGSDGTASTISFAPTATRSGIYALLKAILQSGANITLTPNDSGETIAIAGQAGGGGSSVDYGVQYNRIDLPYNSGVQWTYVTGSLANADSDGEIAEQLGSPGRFKVVTANASARALIRQWARIGQKFEMGGTRVLTLSQNYAESPTGTFTLTGTLTGAQASAGAVSFRVLTPYALERDALDGAGIVTLLAALTGNARLSYNSLKDTPAGISSEQIRIDEFIDDPATLRLDDYDIVQSISGINPTGKIDLTEGTGDPIPLYIAVTLDGKTNDNRAKLSKIKTGWQFLVHNTDVNTYVFGTVTAIQYQDGNGNNVNSLPATHGLVEFTYELDADRGLDAYGQLAAGAGRFHYRQPPVLHDLSNTADINPPAHGDPVGDGTRILVLKSDGTLEELTLAHFRRHLGSGVDFAGYTYTGADGANYNSSTADNRVARVGSTNQYVVTLPTVDSTDFGQRDDEGNLFEIVKANDDDVFAFGVISTTSQGSGPNAGVTFVTLSAVYTQGSLAANDDVIIRIYTEHDDVVLPYTETAGTNDASGNTSVPMRYTRGTTLSAKFTNANTGDLTLNVNQTGAQAVHWRDGQRVNGDFPVKAGATYQMVYNGSAFILDADSPLQVLDIHDNAPTHISGPLQASDRFIVSREDETGDPTEYVTFEDVERAIVKSTAADTTQTGLTLAASIEAVDAAGEIGYSTGEGIIAYQPTSGNLAAAREAIRKGTVLTIRDSSGNTAVGTVYAPLLVGGKFTIGVEGSITVSNTAPTGTVSLEMDTPAITDYSDLPGTPQTAYANTTTSVAIGSGWATRITNTAGLSITPRSSASKFKVEVGSTMGSVSGQAKVDIRLQRKIGTGNWTTVRTKAYWMLVNFGNPPGAWGPIEDSPNTTETVSYRIEMGRNPTGSHTGTLNLEEGFLFLTEIVG